MQYYYCIYYIRAIFMIDWQYILSDLLKHKTQQELCKEIGISQPFLSQLKNGTRKDVKYHIGAKLLQLHSQNVRHTIN